MMPDHCYSCGMLVREDEPIQFANNLWCSGCAEAHGIVKCPFCELVYDSTNETHDCQDEDPDDAV